MPTPFFSSFFFFPLLLFPSGCRSLGSETAVSVTWERSTRKAPAVRGTGVSFCLYGNLIEESWKDLSTSSGKEGQKSSCLPLTIWRNSNPTFFLFFLGVYVALLPSTGWRGNCQGMWGGVWGGNSVRGSLKVLHQWEFISNQWKDHCNESLSYDIAEFCKQPSHLSNHHPSLASLSAPGSFHTKPNQCMTECRFKKLFLLFYVKMHQNDWSLVNFGLVEYFNILKLRVGNDSHREQGFF